MGIMQMPNPFLPHFHLDAIIAKIKESGFNVSLSNEATLTREMAEQMYSKQNDKEFYNDLVDMMTRSVCWTA